MSHQMSLRPKVETTLIIKFGALGDFLLSLGPCESIRRTYPNDHLILWTTPPFAKLAKKAGLFDEIWQTHRFSSWNLFQFGSCLRRIKNAHVKRIFDLQTSDHTSRYYYGLRVGGWEGDFSGIARGSRWRHTNPNRNFLHTIERQKDQLSVANIHSTHLGDLGFLEQEGAEWFLKNKKNPDFSFLEKPYALLVPGGTLRRPLKRWPLIYWKELCGTLIQKSIVPVLIGGKDELALADQFDTERKDGVNLIGKTSFSQLAYLGTKALAAVGNDTGPMHLLALVSCPTLTLFCTRASDPALCAPSGPNAMTLSSPSLVDLSSEMVMDSLDQLIKKAQKKDH